MTVETLKKIIDALPTDTQVYIEGPNAWEDLRTVIAEYDEEGGTRLVLSTKVGY